MRKPSSSRKFRGRHRSLCFAVMLLSTGVSISAEPEQFRRDPLLLDDFLTTLPTHGSTGGMDYEIIQGYAVLEGDILLGQVDATGRIPTAITPRGLGLNGVFGRWPDGIVPYEIPTSGSTSAIQQSNIEQAIAHWVENTSLSFVPRTSENASEHPYFLRFRSSNGCASYVGRIAGGLGSEPDGAQPVMVADACSVGSVIHEIGHAVGLFHEHTRSDRDSFVQINWGNVEEGKEINFSIQGGGTSDIGDYDYGSIMHYGDSFFSFPLGSKTILVPDGVEVGQRIALSDQDIQAVDAMYATDLSILQPVVIAEDGNLEIDISVINQGALGAHNLELIVKLASDSTWLGVSSNSGWQCATYTDQLHCYRDTLQEGLQSRFLLLVDPGSGDESELAMLLQSRTQDFDTTNNQVNEDATFVQVPGTQSISPINNGLVSSSDQSDNDNTGSSGGIIEPSNGIVDINGNNTPTFGAAQNGVDTASAGSVHPFSLLSLIALIFSFRRVRRRPR